MGPRQKDKDQSKCSICREPGDGFHFGAEACRACAAFFRRSVSQSKTYLCQGNNDCDVTVNIRCMCRACRYVKCIEVGMNPVGVQQKPRLPKNRKEVSIDLLSSPRTSNSLMLELPLTGQMPILSKIRASYQTMCNARIALHKAEDKTVFEKRTPKAVNYKEAVKQGMKDVTLASDWVSWSFDEFSNLPIDQKRILFHNSYTAFFIMESGFSSHLNNTPDAITFPSGDYIDTNDLNSFYNGTDSDKQISSEDINRLFKPSYERFKKSVILPMMTLQMDIIEYLALFTMLLWDTGLIELSDECIKIGDKIKTQVLKELDFYMRNVKKVEEPLVRIGTLVNILPDVHKSVRRIQDDLEMTKVFNLYAPSDEFYDLVMGNYN